MSSTRRLLFSITPAVVVLATLELSLRIVGFSPVTYDEDPYVGFSSRLPLFVRESGESGSRWSTAHNKRTHFNRQSFDAAKPDETLRIFCLGGSTTYGRPYSDDTSFCGWLRVHLEIAEPERSFEVINAGGISYASYRVAMLMEELIAHEPDVFVLYSGHNEFLEQRTYESVIATPEALRGVAAALATTRVYALVRLVVDGVRDMRSSRSSPDLLPAEVDPLLDHSVGPAAYTRDDELATRVVGHYRFNLARMIDMARSVGALPIVVSPASNLRDFSPFKSEASIGEPAKLARVSELLALSDDQRAAGQLEEALASLERAGGLDPRRADLHFARGRLLLALGRSEEAARAFARARDEDVCPLRSLSSIDAAIREVAGEREAPLVDFRAWAEREAASGIPGADLFLDHVHPTPEANRALSLLIVDALAERGLASPRDRWPADAVNRARARVEAGLDQSAQGQALRNLSKVLAWAGKFEEADALALEAVSLSPDDAGAQFQAGNAHHRAGDLEQARIHYARSVTLRPGHVLSRIALGRVLTGQRRFAAAEEQLRTAVKLRPESAAAHNALGVALASQRRFLPALDHFERALSRDPAIEPARSMAVKLRRAAAARDTPESGG